MLYCLQTWIRNNALYYLFQFLRYSSALTGLRFVAIAMVLLEHFAGFIGYPISSGLFGVNLFFVLSGFLITSILVSQQDLSPLKAYLNFLARRGLRIFPIYYLTIVVLLIIKAPFILQRWPYLVTYTYNYQLAYLNFPSEPYRPMWSLCVEEQFYLFFPIIAIALRKRWWSLLTVCSLLISIGILQLFFAVLTPAGYNYVSLITNMIPLALGAVGAMISNKNFFVKWLFNNYLIEVFALVLIAVSMYFFNYPFQMIIFSGLNLYLVIKAYHFRFSIGWINSFMTKKIVVLLGQISYGIYLYHNLVQFYFTKYIFGPIWNKITFENFEVFSFIEFHSWVVKLPLYSFITFILAYYSYKIIEQPILKLKDCYFKSTTTWKIYSRRSSWQSVGYSEKKIIFRISMKRGRSSTCFRRGIN